MKKPDLSFPIFRSIIIVTAAILIISSCDKDQSGADRFEIKGITTDNYPKVDGSTSTQPLQTLMACKLLDITYDWSYDWMYMHYTITPPYTDEESLSFILNNVRNTGTHTSIMNLINGEADFILVARKASDEERDAADSKNVKLVEVPVAIDAFVFIVNQANPVNDLTTEQIRDIYTGTITNWSEVGGNISDIDPYKRNATSGSQVLMEELVMKDAVMIDVPQMGVSHTMWGPFDLLSQNPDGICYSVYYYKEFMARASEVKHISVDGVYPDGNSLKTRNYPYTTDVYAVVREDLDKSSLAYKLFKLLLTNQGQKVIKESGYVAY